ncbi:hypothetical protein SKAU_G00180310 [Synaphobranchus kaupii]|uniref:Uncharacterized protein n=1 Tax=Synaphobranchus kaupii TaxID=118154 RepID=A0A9Q1FM98_SYNKA|nr:hypothetical protein SKAU_G00180310 [Synaphobranchus kaupii]
MKWTDGSGGGVAVARLFLPFLLHTVSGDVNNLPPQFKNYFFQNFLLIYEDTAIDWRRANSVVCFAHPLLLRHRRHGQPRPFMNMIGPGASDWNGVIPDGLISTARMVGAVWDVASLSRLLFIGSADVLVWERFLCSGARPSGLCKQRPTCQSELRGSGAVRFPCEAPLSRGSDRIS